MKQFFTILKYEYLGYVKGKTFLILTGIMVLLLAGLMFYPRVFGSGSDGSDTSSVDTSDMQIALIDHTSADGQSLADYMNQSGAGMFIATDQSENQITLDVENGTYDAALVVDSALSYRYIVNNAGMYDSTNYTIEAMLTAKYQADTLAGYGLSAAETQQILSASAQGDVIETGTNQFTSFLYTYVLIFLLYMAIMLYGQFVAMSVASEKSSRAMELLITSADSNNLMFGKVIGSGLAGLTQMALILVAGFACYNLNLDYWGGNSMMESIFGMPFSVVIYALVFFIGGFFLYAFLYGALGSLASRTEDVNTLVMPVTLLFIVAFIGTVTSLASGNVDTTLMKVLSYIPLTSPMAMFTRVAMNSVLGIGVAISIGILFLSTMGVGYLSSIVYRMGVLMYGKPPKMRELIKMLKSK